MCADGWAESGKPRSSWRQRKQAERTARLEQSEAVFKFPDFWQTKLVRFLETGRKQVRAKTPFEAGIRQLFLRDRLLMFRSLTIWLNAKLIPFQT